MRTPRTVLHLIVTLAGVVAWSGCSDTSTSATNATPNSSPPVVVAQRSAVPPPPASQTIPPPPVNQETPPNNDPPPQAQPPADQPPQFGDSSNSPPPDAANPPAESDSSKSKKILGKTTQDVRDAAKEKAKAAQEKKNRVTGKDPITVAGSTYVTIVGLAAVNSIKHAVDLFQAEHGRYPKDTNEFMTQIIKANHINLPKLPFYQEYGYDPQKHELIILEYPDKKPAGAD